MGMTREQIIEELKVFIAYFAEEQGAMPVCMIEAVKMLEEDEVKFKKIFKILSK